MFLTVTKQLSQQLINTWEWLDAFCLTQRGDCNLACGQHAIVVVQIDDFISIREKLGEERTAELLSNMENLMKEYALDDTLVARYNDYTFAVVLHYLTGRDEIMEICEEIRESINNAKKKWKDQVTVSVGAAECHHDPKEGYKCATRLALEALAEAKLVKDTSVIAPDTLKPHPLAVEKMQEEKGRA